MASRSKQILFSSILLLCIGITSVVLDRVLSLFGLPAEHPALLYPIAPPHIKVEVDNIEFHYSITTNSLGIRDRDRPLTKPSLATRIVVLGDSYSEGWGVADEERWSNRLERRLQSRSSSPIEVVNCAESGTGPAEYLAAFTRVCSAYMPDLVLVGVYTNDVASTTVDTQIEPLLHKEEPQRTGLKALVHILWPHLYTQLMLAREAYRSPNAVDPDQVLDKIESVARSKAIPEETIRRWREAIPAHIEDAVAKDQFNSALLSYPLLKPSYYYESFDLSGDLGPRKFRTLLDIMTALHKYCQSVSARLILLYLPSELQYDPASFDSLSARLYAVCGSPMHRSWLSSETELQIQLRHWATSNDIQLWDLTSGFRDAHKSLGSTLNYQVDGHWTPLGHKVAADLVYQRFATAGTLVPYGDVR